MPRWSIPNATRSASGSRRLPELNPAGLRLVDSHAHIQTQAFEKDGDEVLAAAYAAGVERRDDLPSSERLEVDPLSRTLCLHRANP